MTPFPNSTNREPMLAFSDGLVGLTECNLSAFHADLAYKLSLPLKSAGCPKNHLCNATKACWQSTRWYVGALTRRKETKAAAGRLTAVAAAHGICKPPIARIQL